MSALVIVALAVAGGLAFVNGANDVSRGISTLVGAGVTSYRRAIQWGTLWTGLGALAGASLGAALLVTFGSGLIADGHAPTLGAALATLLGAAAWVGLATWRSLPVSTTHAIVGALVGATAVSQGLAGVSWSALGAKVFLPLLLSPLAAASLAVLMARFTAKTSAVDCVCVELAAGAAQAQTDGSALVRTAMRGPISVRVTTASTAVCQAEHPTAAALTLTRAHWLTAGLTSFARGVNDGPKIAALALALAALAESSVSTGVVFVVVTASMVAGSLVGGRRVTRTLAEKVTPMSDRAGASANLVTATLVTTGAAFGWPMSTTHVAGGVVFGVGYVRGTLDRRVLREILLAWLITLPAAAGLAALAFALVQTLTG